MSLAARVGSTCLDLRFDVCILGTAIKNLKSLEFVSQRQCPVKWCPVFSADILVFVFKWDCSKHNYLHLHTCRSWHAVDVICSSVCEIFLERLGVGVNCCQSKTWKRVNVQENCWNRRVKPVDTLGHYLTRNFMVSIGHLVNNEIWKAAIDRACC